MSAQKRERTWPEFVQTSPDIDIGSFNGRQLAVRRGTLDGAEKINLAWLRTNKAGLRRAVGGIFLPAEAAAAIAGALQGIAPERIKPKPKSKGLDLGDWLLLEIAEGTHDYGPLAAQLYPDDERGRDKVRAQVARLRLRAHWIERNGWELTPCGLDRLNELRANTGGVE